MTKAMATAIALAAALSISACTSEPTAGAQAASARPWEIGFELSGGFAGTEKRMTIFRDGRLVAEDQRRRARAEKRLSGEQMRELDRLVERMESVPEPASLSRCADCMQYRLSVAASEGKPALQEGTIEGRQTGNRDLLAFLIALLNDALQP